MTHQSIRTFIILLFTILTTQFVFSQDTISQNTVIDKQTKLRTLEQSRWEKLVINKTLTIYFHISSIGTSDFFNIRIIRNDVGLFTIESGQQLVFRFSNKDSLSLINPKTEYGCIGCGAVTLAGGGTTSGIEVSYMISKAELSKLEVNMVKKLIVYTANGKIENELTVKDNQKILTAIIATQDL